MEKQQVETLLFNEQFSMKFSIQSHPKRRQIADCLAKVCLFVLFIYWKKFLCFS